MSLKQLSVFLPNRAGALTEVCSKIAEKGIDMYALSLADSQDFGILRIIVKNPDFALEELKKAGYTCKITRVVAVKIENKQGSMAKALKTISDAGVEIEYAYAFSSNEPGYAYMVFRVGGMENRHIVYDLGLDLIDGEL